MDVVEVPTNKPIARIDHNDAVFKTMKGKFNAVVEEVVAAHEKGLGTVVMGIYDEEKVKEVLGIGEDKSVSALIALGYPADALAAPKRKEVADLLTSM